MNLHGLPHQNLNLARLPFRHTRMLRLFACERTVRLRTRLNIITNQRKLHTRKMQGFTSTASFGLVFGVFSGISAFSRPCRGCFGASRCPASRHFQGNNIVFYGENPPEIFRRSTPYRNSAHALAQWCDNSSKRAVAPIRARCVLNHINTRHETRLHDV